MLLFFFYSRPPRHLQSCSKKHSRGFWNILDFFQAFEVTVIFPPTLIFLWAGWLLLLSTSVTAMASVFRYELAHICVDSVLLIHPYVSCINNSRHSFTLIKLAHLLMICPCLFVAKTYTWWLLGGSAKATSVAILSRWHPVSVKSQAPGPRESSSNTILHDSVQGGVTLPFPPYPKAHLPVIPAFKSLFALKHSTVVSNMKDSVS